LISDAGIKCSTDSVKFIATICQHYQILQLCVKFVVFLTSEIHSGLLKICLFRFSFVGKEEFLGGGFEESRYTYSVPTTLFLGTEGVPDIDRKPIGTLSFATVQ